MKKNKLVEQIKAKNIYKKSQAKNELINCKNHCVTSCKKIKFLKKK